MSVLTGSGKRFLSRLLCLAQIIHPSLGHASLLAEDDVQFSRPLSPHTPVTNSFDRFYPPFDQTLPVYDILPDEDGLYHLSFDPSLYQASQNFYLADPLQDSLVPLALIRYDHSQQTLYFDALKDNVPFSFKGPAEQTPCDLCPPAFVLQTLGKLVIENGQFSQDTSIKAQHLVLKGVVKIEDVHFQAPEINVIGTLSGLSSKFEASSFYLAPTGRIEGSCLDLNVTHKTVLEGQLIVNFLEILGESSDLHLTGSLKTDHTTLQVNQATLAGEYFSAFSHIKAHHALTLSSLFQGESAYLEAPLLTITPDAHLDLTQDLSVNSQAKLALKGIITAPQLDFDTSHFAMTGQAKMKGNLTLKSADIIDLEDQAHIAGDILTLDSRSLSQFDPETSIQAQQALYLTGHRMELKGALTAPELHIKSIFNVILKGSIKSSLLFIEADRFLEIIGHVHADYAEITAPRFETNRFSTLHLTQGLISTNATKVSLQGHIKLPFKPFEFQDQKITPVLHFDALEPTTDLEFSGDITGNLKIQKAKKTHFLPSLLLHSDRVEIDSLDFLLAKKASAYVTDSFNLTGQQALLQGDLSVNKPKLISSASCDSSLSSISIDVSDNLTAESRLDAPLVQLIASHILTSPDFRWQGQKGYLKASVFKTAPHSLIQLKTAFQGDISTLFSHEGSLQAPLITLTGTHAPALAKIEMKGDAHLKGDLSLQQIDSFLSSHSSHLKGNLTVQKTRSFNLRDQAQVEGQKIFIDVTEKIQAAGPSLRATESLSLKGKTGHLDTALFAPQIQAHFQESLRLYGSLEGNFAHIISPSFETFDKSLIRLSQGLRSENTTLFSHQGFLNTPLLQINSPTPLQKPTVIYKNKAQSLGKLEIQNVQKIQLNDSSQIKGPLAIQNVQEIQFNNASQLQGDLTLQKAGMLKVRDQAQLKGQRLYMDLDSVMTTSEITMTASDFLFLTGKKVHLLGTFQAPHIELISTQDLVSEGRVKSHTLRLQSQKLLQGGTLISPTIILEAQDIQTLPLSKIHAEKVLFLKGAQASLEGEAFIGPEEVPEIETLKHSLGTFQTDLSDHFHLKGQVVSPLSLINAKNKIEISGLLQGEDVNLISPVAEITGQIDVSKILNSQNVHQFILKGGHLHLPLTASQFGKERINPLIQIVSPVLDLDGEMKAHHILIRPSVSPQSQTQGTPAAQGSASPSPLSLRVKQGTTLWAQQADIQAGQVEIEPHVNFYIRDLLFLKGCSASLSTLILPKDLKVEMEDTLTLAGLLQAQRLHVIAPYLEILPSAQLNLTAGMLSQNSNFVSIQGNIIVPLLSFFSHNKFNKPTIQFTSFDHETLHHKPQIEIMESAEIKGNLNIKNVQSLYLGNQANIQGESLFIQALEMVLHGPLTATQAILLKGNTSSVYSQIITPQFQADFLNNFQFYGLLEGNLAFIASPFVELWTGSKIELTQGLKLSDQEETFIQGKVKAPLIEISASKEENANSFPTVLPFIRKGISDPSRPDTQTLNHVKTSILKFENTEIIGDVTVKDMDHVHVTEMRMKGNFDIQKAFNTIIRNLWNILDKEEKCQILTAQSYNTDFECFSRGSLKAKQVYVDSPNIIIDPRFNFQVDDVLYLKGRSALLPKISLSGDIKVEMSEDFTILKDIAARQLHVIAPTLQILPSSSLTLEQGLLIDNTLSTSVLGPIEAPVIQLNSPTIEVASHIMGQLSMNATSHLTLTPPARIDHLEIDLGEATATTLPILPSELIQRLVYKGRALTLQNLNTQGDISFEMRENLTLAAGYLQAGHLQVIAPLFHILPPCHLSLTRGLDSHNTTRALIQGSLNSSLTPFPYEEQRVTPVLQIKSPHVEIGGNISGNLTLQDAQTTTLNPTASLRGDYIDITSDQTLFHSNHNMNLVKQFSLKGKTLSVDNNIQANTMFINLSDPFHLQGSLNAQIFDIIAPSFHLLPSSTLNVNHMRSQNSQEFMAQGKISNNALLDIISPKIDISTPLQRTNLRVRGATTTDIRPSAHIDGSNLDIDSRNTTFQSNIYNTNIALNSTESLTLKRVVIQNVLLDIISPKIDLSATLHQVNLKIKGATTTDIQPAASLNDSNLDIESMTTTFHPGSNVTSPAHTTNSSIALKGQKALLQGNISSPLIQNFTADLTESLILQGNLDLQRAKADIKAALFHIMNSGVFKVQEFKSEGQQKFWAEGQITVPYSSALTTAAWIKAPVVELSGRLSGDYCIYGATKTDFMNTLQMGVSKLEIESDTTTFHPHSYIAGGMYAPVLILKGRNAFVQTQPPHHSLLKPLTFSKLSMMLTENLSLSGHLKIHQNASIQAPTLHILPSGILEGSNIESHNSVKALIEGKVNPILPFNRPTNAPEFKLTSPHVQISGNIEGKINLPQTNTLEFMGSQSKCGFIEAQATNTTFHPGSKISLEGLALKGQNLNINGHLEGSTYIHVSSTHISPSGTLISSPCSMIGNNIIESTARFLMQGQLGLESSKIRIISPAIDISGKIGKTISSTSNGFLEFVNSYGGHPNGILDIQAASYFNVTYPGSVNASQLSLTSPSINFGPLTSATASQFFLFKGSRASLQGDFIGTNFNFNLSESLMMQGKFKGFGKNLIWSPTTVFNGGDSDIGSLVIQGMQTSFNGQQTFHDLTIRADQGISFNGSLTTPKGIFVAPSVTISPAAQVDIYQIYSDTSSSFNNNGRFKAQTGLIKSLSINLGPNSITGPSCQRVSVPPLAAGTFLQEYNRKQQQISADTLTISARFINSAAGALLQVNKGYIQAIEALKNLGQINGNSLSIDFVNRTVTSSVINDMGQVQANQLTLIAPYFASLEQILKGKFPTLLQSPTLNIQTQQNVVLPQGVTSAQNLGVTAPTIHIPHAITTLHTLSFQTTKGNLTASAPITAHYVTLNSAAGLTHQALHTQQGGTLSSHQAYVNRHTMTAAQGGFNITAPSLINHSLIQARSSNLHATHGSITNRGTLDGIQSLHAEGGLINRRTLQNIQEGAQIKVASVDNSGLMQGKNFHLTTHQGGVTNTARGTLSGLASLQAQGAFHNKGQVSDLQTGATLKAASILNDGSIQGASFNLKADQGSVRNRGLLSGLKHVQAQGRFSNTSTIKNIQTGAKIEAASFDNAGTMAGAAADVILNKGGFTNTGTLEGLGHVHAKRGAFSNTGHISKVRSHAQIRATSFDNAGTMAGAAADVILNKGGFTNTGTLEGLGHVQAEHGAFSNTGTISKVRSHAQIRATSFDNAGTMAGRNFDVKTTQGDAVNQGKLTGLRHLQARQAFLNKGQIATGSETSHIRAASIENRDTITGRDVRLHATHGDIVNHHHIEATEYLQAVATGDILNQGKSTPSAGLGQAPTFTPARMVGGTGLVYTDAHGQQRRLGAHIQAQGRVVNDISQMTAHGDVLIQGDQGIVHQGRSMEYLDSETHKSGFLGFNASHTKVYKTAVGRPLVGSTHGKLMQESIAGRVTEIAADIISKDGDTIYARDNVEYGAFATRTRVETERASWWGLTSRASQRTTEQACPTRIVSGGTVYHRSAEGQVKGQAPVVIAQNYVPVGQGENGVDLQGLTLNHHEESSSTGLRFTSPLAQTLAGIHHGDHEAVMAQHPQAAALHSLATAETQAALTRAALQAGMQAQHIREALHAGTLGTHLLSTLATVGVEMNTSHARRTWTTTQPPVIAVRGIFAPTSTGPNSSVRLGGGTLASFDTFAPQADRVIIEGARDTEQRTHESSSLGLNLNPLSGFSLGARHHTHTQDATTFTPARFTGRHVDLSGVREMDLIDAQIHTQSAQGHLDRLTILSHQNEMRSHSEGGSISLGLTSGGLGLSRNTTHIRHTPTPSGFFVATPAGHRVTLEQLNVTGPALPQDWTDRADRVSFTRTYDINRSNGFNLALSGLDLTSGTAFVHSLGQRAAMMAGGVLAAETARSAGLGDVGASLAGAAGSWATSQALPTYRTPLGESHLGASGFADLNAAGTFAYHRNGQQTDIFLMHRTLTEPMSGSAPDMDMEEDAENNQNSNQNTAVPLTSWPTRPPVVPRREAGAQTQGRAETASTAPARPRVADIHASYGLHVPTPRSLDHIRVRTAPDSAPLNIIGDFARRAAPAMPSMPTPTPTTTSTASTSTSTASTEPSRTFTRVVNALNTPPQPASKSEHLPTQAFTPEDVDEYFAEELTQRLQDLKDNPEAQAKAATDPSKSGSTTPPLLDKTPLKNTLGFLGATINHYTPERVKQGLHYAGQGAHIISDYTPRPIKSVVSGTFSALNYVLDQAGTGVRRGLRGIGAPQALAQDFGDAASFLTPGAVLKVGKTLTTAARTFRAATTAETAAIIAAEHAAIRQEVLSTRYIKNEHLKDLGFKGDRIIDRKAIDSKTQHIRANTEITGGKREAEQMLKTLKREFKIKGIDTKIKEPGRTGFIYKDGSLVQIRPEGKSGHYKIDITDTILKIEEKITFNPEIK